MRHFTLLNHGDGKLNTVAHEYGFCDMVKCELRVADASCLYFASYDLRVALIVRVTSCAYYASCELNERCELETQKCELKPKMRVACFLL